MDVEEAAHFLRVKPATLYGWVHERRIPFRKHGRRLVFSVADIMSWSGESRHDEIKQAAWGITDVPAVVEHDKAGISSLKSERIGNGRQPPSRR